MGELEHPINERCGTSWWIVANAEVEFNIDGDPTRAHVDEFDVVDSDGNSVLESSEYEYMRTLNGDDTLKSWIESQAVLRAWDDDGRPTAAECLESAREFALDCEII